MITSTHAYIRHHTHTHTLSRTHTFTVPQTHTQVVLMADGQVTSGSEIVKPNVKKLRRIGDGVIGGFAGMSVVQAALMLHSVCVLLLIYLRCWMYSTLSEPNPVVWQKQKTPKRYATVDDQHWTILDNTGQYVMHRQHS